jgi:L-fuconolactonase
LSELKPVAAIPGISCKLSGLVTEARWESWTTDDLRPYVQSALDLFGPKRMMFGSDHPVCLLAASYERVLDSFQEILKDFSDEDRAGVFANNATSFYRLN